MNNEELETLKFWLNSRELRVSSYRLEKSIGHPVLNETQVIDAISNAIKNGDQNAIDLGCEFVLELRKMPYGKILKSNILVALKQKAPFVGATYKQQISSAAMELLSWKYPPREIREFCKLVQRFEPSYAEAVVEQAQCISNEAERWVQFLREGT